MRNLNMCLLLSVMHIIIGLQKREYHGCNGLLDRVIVFLEALFRITFPFWMCTPLPIW